MKVEREEYGFDWPPNFDKDQHWRYTHKRKLTDLELVAEWDALGGNYERCKALKKLVRKGIPRQYRVDVWLSISSAGKNLAENKGLYNELTARCADKDINSSMKDTSGERVLDVIKRDLARTFPENPSFKEPVMLNNMQDILAAFCLHRPEIGYCQGLNFIVGALLIATQRKDGELLPEECFWLLVALVEILPDYHSSKMTCLNNDCLVLSDLVRKTVPQTHSVVTLFGLPLQMFVTKWFVCLFVDVLPFHTVLHVWDTLFYEGNKIIFRVAVYQFVLHKRELKKLNDPSGLAMFFRDLFWDGKAWDNFEYMRKVFKKTRHMKRKYIEHKRITKSSETEV